MAKDKAEIFVGQKAFMNYVMAAVLQLNSGENEVTIKARGKYISRAVDIAEVVKNRFSDTGVKTGDIKIGSEEFDAEGKKIRVSTIEIKLTKEAKK